MALRPLNGLSLCSGIAGLELGLKLALGDAYRTVAYVEREAFPAALLVARMEEGTLDPAPVWDDLATFDGRRWRGRVDVVTAGFPCQPFSCAGKRKGTEDERWLWPDIARIVGECEPSLARDWKSEDGTHSPDHSPPLGRQVLTTSQAGRTGSERAVLNPQFVAALMGFPSGWISFGRLEMGLCPWLRLMRSEFLRLG